MSAIGGSIVALTLKGRRFAVAADAEAQRNVGGFENDVQANGDGSGRIVKTRKPWSLTGITVEVDDSRGDHEFLQDLADLPDPFPCSVEFASAIVFQGQGTITGELAASSTNATSSLSLMGPGKFTPQ